VCVLVCVLVCLCLCCVCVRVCVCVSVRAYSCVRVSAALSLYVCITAAGHSFNRWCHHARLLALEARQVEVVPEDKHHQGPCSNLPSQSEQWGLNR
jgi:hypothetical protein